VWDALTPEDVLVRFHGPDQEYLSALQEAVNAAPNRSVAFHGSHVSLTIVMLLRLAEHALHSWDIRVSLKPSAEVAPQAAQILLDHYPRPMLSMVADRAVARSLSPADVDVHVSQPPRSLRLRILTDGVHVLKKDTDAVEPTGRLELPTAAAWCRLVSGRLDPMHTPHGAITRAALTFLG
jgi:hypothetical protein